MAGRRSFPYWSSVPSFELQRGGGSNTGGVNPGQEAAGAPRTFEPSLGQHGGPQAEQHFSDFTTWTEAQIKEFLDVRGEDYDDCNTFDKLVLRARECEVSTGPAPDPNKELPAAGEEGDDEEYDPLDAFMAGIEADVQASKSAAAPSKPKPEREEAEDNVADYLEARNSKSAAVASAFHGTGYNSDEEVYATAKAIDAGAEVEYDANDNPILDKRHVEPLAALDHSQIEYWDFNKDFYSESKEIAGMADHEVNAMRRQLDVHVAGFGAPRPVKTFRHCGFDARLLAAISKQGYDAPTAIQAQALPAALSGRDVLGVAKTGSGKTAAFVLPMVVHIMDQPELEKGEGPIGIIVAPTRELSEQIHKEARKFSKPYGLRTVAAFGGLSKQEQFKHLKGGSEIAVCTPGRMIDLLKMKACSCMRTTYLVFDEADRMFDMGFEPQVRSIVGQIRPDRQTMLFSATMPKRVERLAREALVDPIRITVGRVGGANEDINQVVEVMDDDMAKFGWLLAKMPAFVDEGDVMVFVNQRARVDELVQQLKGSGFKVDGVHGDHDQHTRMDVLKRFRGGDIHILVATDVAARGLDIKSVKTVVNMDAPKDIDTYVHRIGRTGRAGDKEGVAYTFVTQNQTHFAGDLVHTLVASNKEVPRALHELAMKSGKFRNGGKGGRGGGRGGIGGPGRGRGRGRGIGGVGLGFASGDPPPPQTSAQAAGYAPAASRATTDVSMAPHSGGDVNDGGMALPPGPPSRPVMPGFAPAKASVAMPGFTPAKREGGMSGFVSASSAPSAPVGQTTGVTEPRQTREQILSQMRSSGTAHMKDVYASRYKSSFVASSTGAVRPDAPVATVVAPRRAATQAVPPPPVPVAVAAAPAIAAQRLATRIAPTGFSGGGFSAAPPQAAPPAGPQFDAAVAAAQAIAARLAGGGGESGSGAPAYPPPPLQQPERGEQVQDEQRRKRKWDS